MVVVGDDGEVAVMVLGVVIGLELSWEEFVVGLVGGR